MDTEAQLIVRITEVLDQLHEKNLKQHEFNQLVVKKLAIVEQELNELKALR